MTTFQLQQLRDLPIEGVAERLGLQVSRHKCLCPFHDDHTPSMTFRHNKYKCWSCGESGDTISLAMKYLNKDFLEATKWLAEGSNVIVSSFKFQDSGDLKPETRNLKPFDASRYARFFEHPWLSAEARKFLYDERRIDPRVVRWCRLTSWKDKRGVPWLQIPYYDREGKLIGVQNRNLSLTPNPSPKRDGSLTPQGEVGGGSPRFRFPCGSKCSIYNLPVLNLLKPGEPLFIAEGCSDCWSLMSAGHKAIAIPSATLLSKNDIELLLSLTLSLSYHMYPDNDTPGERLFLQLKEVLPHLVHHQLPPGCKDFSDYYIKMTGDK